MGKSSVYLSSLKKTNSNEKDQENVELLNSNSTHLHVQCSMNNDLLSMRKTKSICIFPSTYLSIYIYCILVMSFVYLSIHMTVHAPITTTLTLVNMMCQQMSQGQSLHRDLKGQLRL